MYVCMYVWWVIYEKYVCVCTFTYGEYLHVCFLQDHHAHHGTLSEYESHLQYEQNVCMYACMYVYMKNMSYHKAAGHLGPPFATGLTDRYVYV